MINVIEALRIEQKKSKTELAVHSDISVQMYHKYLKGSSISIDVFRKMLDYLGYELTAIKKDSSIKL